MSFVIPQRLKKEMIEHAVDSMIHRLRDYDTKRHHILFGFEGIQEMTDDYFLDWCEDEFTDPDGDDGPMARLCKEARAEIAIQQALAV